MNSAVNTSVRSGMLWIAVLVTLACCTSSIGCKRSAAGNRQQGQPPEVAVVVVEPGPVTLTVKLPARTVPYLVAEVRPQVSGIVQKRLFEEGADVKAGDVLYQIDPATYQAAYDSAAATLAKSVANVIPLRNREARYKELVAIKAVSQQEYDDVSAALKLAEADILFCKANADNARTNLERTRVTAPISGRIGRSSVTDGALVTAGQPAALATIQQLDPIYVDVPQSSNELLRLRQSMDNGSLSHDAAGQSKVKLVLEDGAAYPQEGTLQFRDISVDPSTGSVILRTVFPNPRGTLLPGMFVMAEINEGVNEKAILVPQQTVARDVKGNPVALIVNAEGKVEQRMLGLDRAIGNKWLVATGLASGEKVIAEGIQKVRPGVVVKEVPFTSAPKPGAAPADKTNPSAESH